MRRPPKPRIVKPRLKWAWNNRRECWDPYHRVTWTADGKTRERAIKLDWQGDPARLDELYWQCQSNQHDAQKPPTPKYTWGALIIAWRSDPLIQGKLSAGTKRAYARRMDTILEKNRDKPVANTTRQMLRRGHAAMADTPREADWRIQIVSLLWNYGKQKLDWPIGENPAAGLDKYGVQNPFEPWPEWMVAKLVDAPANVRTAAELILGTGQRPSAAIAMPRAAFNGDWMTVVDEKQDEPFETFCPADLRKYIIALPPRGKHVLAKNLVEPLGYDAVEKAFRGWRTGLGERARPYSLHGLRKLAIIRLAEAGCSDAEIQAVTNQSAETVAYYRKRANRKRLSRAAQERRT